MSILIKNVNAILEDKIITTDVYIEDGIIKKISDCDNIKADKTIDGTNKHLFPGLVDMHTHLREPGYEYKEDIESGSLAAAAGGFTSICCMPNTKPVCDNAAIASYIVNRAREVGLVKVYPIGAVSKGSEGLELAEIGKMKKAGIVAISDDGKPVENSKLMRYAMQYADDFNLIVLSHAEDKALADEGCVNEGYNSSLTGLKGINRASEEVMVARDIVLAETLNKRVHICHVSTKGSVQLIREAKLRGVKVTAETCPHYFSLTDDIITDFNTNTKVNPPIREHDDKEAIINAIADGTIDCIVTDHAPHHIDDKNVEYALAAFGISGIESSFSLSYTKLVKSGIIDLIKLKDLMSTNPSRLLNLTGGDIKEGMLADLMLADLSIKYTINSDNYKSKGKNTPFNGAEVYGKVINTILNGKITYECE